MFLETAIYTCFAISVFIPFFVFITPRPKAREIWAIVVLLGTADLIHMFIYTPPALSCFCGGMNPKSGYLISAVFYSNFSLSWLC